MAKRLLMITILVIALALFGVAGVGAQQTGPQPDPADNIGRASSGARIPDQYIVQLRAGASADDVAADHGITKKHTYKAAINGFAGHIPPGQLKKVQDDARVESVTPDRTVSLIAVQAAKPTTASSTGQVTPLGVQRIGAAPGSLAYTGTGIGVAIVDTGIDLAHADLAASSVCFDAFGGDCKDGNGHGTHVAGTVAALNNTTGVVGVAPNAVPYAVRVLDNSGGGSDATVMAGLDWVAANADLVTPPIRVVNMSLGRAGTLDDNPSLRASVQALTAKGISVVVAAGNDAGTEVSQQVPATYPEVMAVASTTAADGSEQCRFLSSPIAKDTASYFTTDGALVNGIGVTISAPGEDKENVGKSCFISSVGILSLKAGGGTTRMSGTSMASPHVAGVVALMYEQASGVLSSEAVRTKLRTSANGVGTAPLNSPTSSYTYDGEREGILNAAGALAP